jgi:hypothetical protein
LDVLRQKYDSGLLGWEPTLSLNCCLQQQLYGMAEKSKVQVREALLFILDPGLTRLPL